MTTHRRPRKTRDWKRFAAIYDGNGERTARSFNRRGIFYHFFSGPDIFYGPLLRNVWGVIDISSFSIHAELPIHCTRRNIMTPMQTQLPTIVLI